MRRKRNKITRRQFLDKSLKMGAGLATASVVSNLINTGRAPAFAASKKAGLAPGMIGGPTGFEGAERYQYGPDEAPGRAIEALKKLKAEGKAPKKFVLMVPPGEVGHWENPFPEGAKPLKEVFREETGIDIQLVDTIDTELDKKTVQDFQTGTNAYDVYGTWQNKLGDLARSGALFAYDEFVEKYKPDWLDPKTGYIGGEVTVNTMMKSAGHYYGFHIDGDYPCFYYYRKDLWDDPKERRDFKARYGWELQVPDTWEQLRDISEFFHRPEKGLLGNVGLRNQYWGFALWYPRYLSGDYPNQFYFDENGDPLIYSDAGIKATEEYVDSMKFMHKDAITWGWAEQYPAMAAGQAAMIETFQNWSKFGETPDKPITYGKVRSFGSPGRMIDGKLIRRTVWWPAIGKAIATGTKYPEAAYLLLQWLTSGKVFTYVVANPAGYLDPCRVTDFKDPQVIKSYKPYNVKTYIDVIEHAAPCINVPGVLELENALDENLIEAAVGKKTPAQAMKDAAARWRKTVDKVGRDEFVKAVKAQNPAWPTRVDQPKIKT
ncbi:MAG: extracellular solute-binding protein [candidate division Zixibacteria bacterium]|nr:extracellular solute-binding protein [candidate division Zixibacteria bacterium]